MKRLLRLAAVSAIAIASLAAASGAWAQSPSVIQAYEASHSVPTNIPGVTTFAAPPASFDAVHASDEALAAYGLPPRPDATAAPDAYAKWKRAMLTPTRRATGPLRDMKMTSTNARFGPAPKLAAGTTAGPTSATSYNWSGVVNTVSGLSTWNSKKSFYYVVSEFNVPVARQAPGSCDGGWDYEVSWNGIDGWSNGDVLQGGSLSEAYCNGSTTSTYYCGWVEWYPSYNILCEFGVNPGDDMFVESWDTSATNGYVYIDDETLGVAGTYNLQPTETPYLVGNSAEYIVERPCCDNGHYDTLADYVQDFWADDFAVTFATYNSGQATKAYSGSTASTTYVVDMLDDQGSVISEPVTGGNYDITFYAEGCALSGGCTP